MVQKFCDLMMPMIPLLQLIIHVSLNRDCVIVSIVVDHEYDPLYSVGSNKII